MNIGGLPALDSLEAVHPVAPEKLPRRGLAARAGIGELADDLLQEPRGDVGGGLLADRFRGHLEQDVVAPALEARGEVLLDDAPHEERQFVVVVVVEAAGDLHAERLGPFHVVLPAKYGVRVSLTRWRASLT